MFEKLKKLIEEAKQKAVQSIDPEVFNHPLAVQTDWHPLKGGGANFQTHRLDSSNPDLLVFKATKGAQLFCVIFAAVGLISMAIPTAIFVAEGAKDWALLIFGIIFGGIFLAVGVLMYYFMTVPRVFDTFYGCYYKGRKKPQHNMRAGKKPELVELSDVKAIQLLRERIRSKNGSYYSYEINLVLADASRINVVDHGKHKAVTEDAEILATSLGVPVWDGT
ncbi:MAG: hypothetical protein ACSHWU_05130 [Marinicella sp.]